MIKILNEEAFSSRITGVEPMTFQNTGWTLEPLSYGGLIASKVVN